MFTDRRSLPHSPDPTDARPGHARVVLWLACLVGLACSGLACSSVATVCTPADAEAIGVAHGIQRAQQNQPRIKSGCRITNEEIAAQYRVGYAAGLEEAKARECGYDNAYGIGYQQGRNNQRANTDFVGWCDAPDQPDTRRGFEAGYEVGVEELVAAYRVQNCGYENGYALGYNQAKGGGAMDLSFAEPCTAARQEDTRGGYLEGYKLATEERIANTPVVVRHEGGPGHAGGGRCRWVVPNVPDTEAGCDAWGCWEAGGGCNAYGCWSLGGGCNAFGCWNSPQGSCNAFGCSDVGECNAFDCPEGEIRTVEVCE